MYRPLFAFIDDDGCLNLEWVMGDIERRVIVSVNFNSGLIDYLKIRGPQPSEAEGVIHEEGVVDSTDESNLSLIISPKGMTQLSSCFNLSHCQYLYCRLLDKLYLA